MFYNLYSGSKLHRLNISVPIIQIIHTKTIELDVLLDLCIRGVGGTSWHWVSLKGCISKNVL